MTNREEAVDRVIAAWNEPGIAPHFHRRKQAELLTEWPVLAHAILALTHSDPLDHDYGPADVRPRHPDRG